MASSPAISAESLTERRCGPVREAFPSYGSASNSEVKTPNVRFDATACRSPSGEIVCRWCLALDAFGGIGHDSRILFVGATNVA